MILSARKVSLRGAKRRSNLCEVWPCKDCFVVAPLLLAMTLLALPASAYNEEEAKAVSEDMKEFGFKDVKTKEGLVFRIPSDMPIENRGGLVGPVPFDEYLYIKFKKIEDKLIQVDKKIDRLDETLGAVKKRLDDQAAAAAAPTTAPVPATPKP